MRALGGFCIALLCSGVLLAQHSGGFSRGASHGSSTIRWPYSGYRGYSGTRGGFAPLYAYPVFVGGFYDYGYDGYGYGDPYAGAPQQPNVTVVNPAPPPTSASPVIINLGILPAQGGPSGPPPAPPSSYQQPEQQPDESAAAEPTHYLIALKDHTIYSAVAYWVDGTTLHYFTSGNTHNQISLSLVDRELTQRLNQGSGLEVKLPPAK